MNLAIGLPRLPRSARRQLASHDALRVWLVGLQRPDTPEALGRFLVERMSDWLPLDAWAVVTADEDAAFRMLAVSRARRRLGPHIVAVADAALRARAHWATGSVRASMGSGPDVAAVAWLLRGREKVTGVIVGLDAAPAPRLPAVQAAGLALEEDVLVPAGLALDRVRQFEHMRELAAIDHLTGLYNARHLTRALDRELHRLARGGQPVSVVFMDLDAFKRVNDRHGHLLGSRVLVEVGALLRACTRATDIVARYGGDEFVVVLPDTGRRTALVIARRIQQRFAAETFLSGSGLAARLTVSVGLATLTRPTHTAADLIKSADQAMYWVKRNGRNGIRGVLVGRRAQRGSTSA